MKTALAAFMGLGITAIVIAALVFGVGYQVVDDQATGSDSYKSTVEGVTKPTTAAPNNR